MFDLIRKIIQASNRNITVEEEKTFFICQLFILLDDCGAELKIKRIEREKKGFSSTLFDFQTKRCFPSSILLVLSCEYQKINNPINNKTKIRYVIPPKDPTKKHNNSIYLSLIPKHFNFFLFYFHLIPFHSRMSLELPKYNRKRQIYFIVLFIIHQQ